MFEFFFKRKKPVSQEVPAVPASAAAPTAAPAAAARRAAVEQAGALAGDEAASVAFILGCGVAEARLIAAQSVHSRAALERVRKAMRETDRRVARLMQQRLEAQALLDRTHNAAAALLAESRNLLSLPQLRANQVVAVARQWQALGTIEAEQHTEFDAVQIQLDARLQAQAGLQRQCLDVIAEARAVSGDPGAGRDRIDAAVEHAAAMLLRMRDDAEAAGLPKQLAPDLHDVQQHLLRLQGQASAQADAVAAAEALLDAWAAAAELPPAATLQRQWRELPAIADAAQRQALQERLDQFLATLAPPRQPPLATTMLPGSGDPAMPATHGVPGTVDAVGAAARPGSAPTPAPADPAQRRQERADAIEALKLALDEGALQRATEQDRILRLIDADGTRMSAEQQSTLTALRAELGRLQGWARWGGTISREELLASVEALAQQSLPLKELAQKVGSMRERWRTLDATAGVAPRPLWSRFDAACTTAYAPVAMHFAVLAQQRAENADAAQRLIDEVVEFAVASAGNGSSDGVPAMPPDWRAMAAFCQRVQQAWQRLGPIERKEQKRLDAALAQALAPLLQPLAIQESAEIARREGLIAEVTALSPQARETTERLQSLQATWQQHAKAFPLPRIAEQALWQRFRGACDLVFAARKSAGAAADAERAASLQIRVGICEALESLESLDGGGTTDVSPRSSRVRELRQAWDASGPVPRAAQAAIQQRFDQALQRLDAGAALSKQAATKAQPQVLCTKLRMCLVDEAEVLQPHEGASADGAERRAQWEQLALLATDLEHALRNRFDSALTARAAADAAYARLLQQNQEARDAELLRLELTCGIESPPGQARERLALQVAGLQSTFRNGGGMTTAQSARIHLVRVCGMAALADQQVLQRIETAAEAVLQLP